MYVCLSIILLHNMNKNPLRYECIARDFFIICHHNSSWYGPSQLVAVLWRQRVAIKDSIESEVSMTYDLVCSETQSEKAIQHLGVLILLWRRHYHITQQELAKRTGLLQSYISGLEKGNIDPRISTLCRIVNGFDNMSLDTFFGGPDLGFIDFHGIEHRHIEFH